VKDFFWPARELSARKVRKTKQEKMKTNRFCFFANVTIPFNFIDFYLEPVKKTSNLDKLKFYFKAIVL
jgi:hypothetical protein